MAQHDYVIANGTGAAVRSDLNGSLAAIVSNNSGATEPGTMYAYQWWADTTTGLLKQRNSANNAWVTVGTLASANLGLLSLAGGTMTGALAVTAGTAALPGIAVSGDLNTGIYSPGADQLAISTNGVGRLFVDSVGSVSTAGKLGVGTSSLGAQLQVNTGSAATIGQIIQLASSQTADVLKVVRSDTNNSLQFTPSGQLSFGDINSSPSTVITLGPSTSTNANIKVTANNTGNPNLLLQSMNGGGGSAGAQTSFVYFGDNNRALSYIGGTKTNSSASNASSDLVFGTTPDISTTAVTERARIDSSGRLLVGTSSSSAEAKFIIQGGATAAGGAVNIQRNATTASAGSTIGFINFTNSAGDVGATIAAAGDGTWSAGTSHPTQLVFSTTADGAASPTERLRINSSGQVLYGTTTKNITSPNNPGFEIHATNTGGLGLYSSNTTSGNTCVIFQNPNGRVGFIDINTSSVTYSTSSDHRLKENVAPVSDGITRLQQLKPSRFNFKVDPAKTIDGFIAHEVQTVVPEAITGEKDAVDDDGNPIYQGIDQSKLVPLLTAALQEAVAEIKALKDRVTALESA